MTLSNEKFRVILGYVAITLALAFAAIASSLVMYPERVFELSFWLIVALKTFVSVLTFNVIYYNSTQAKKNDKTPGNALYETFKMYSAYITYIYAHKLHFTVRERISTENKQRFVETATNALHDITCVLDYQDLFDIDGKLLDYSDKVADIIKTYQLTRKQARVLRRTIIKVINGRVKYNKLKYNHIVLNSTESGNRHTSMHISESANLLFRNTMMVLSSLILSALTTIFVLGALNDNLLAEIITNSTIILFAIFNAHVFSTQIINRIKNSFQERIDFFSEFINLERVVATAAVAAAADKGGANGA